MNKELTTKGTKNKAYPKYKPSGVEWLGDVPEHWGVWKVSHVAKVVRGASPRPAGSDLYFGGDHTPWITVAEITKDNDKYLFNVEDYLTAEGRAESRVIPTGTLLLSNSGATLGVPKITQIEGCINDGSVAFFDLEKNIDQNFLFYFLKSLTQILREYAQIAGQPNLNTTIVKGIQLSLPPLPEQHAIAAFLDRETAKIDTLSAKVVTVVERLKEYRTALISSEVTGKINVSTCAKSAQVQGACYDK